MPIKSDRKLKHHMFVARSTIHGKGLFALRSFSRGEYMGTYHGPKTRKNGTYVLWVEDKPDIWVGREGSNMLRYLNHSTKPNAEFDGFDLYALDAIRKGAEITFDYGESPD